MSMELWFIGDDGSVQDYFWYEGNPWQNFELAPAYTASPRGIAAVSRIPTSMELWYVGMHINSYEVGGDISGSSWYQDPTVPEPPNGLSGNVNYFLDAGGSVMTGVTVAIRFTQDFVSTSNAFSFQLNCYSPQSTAITTLVQQFVIYASPGRTQLVARIDNWLNGSPSGELLRVDSPLATMPTTTIQAGYEFQFELQTDPSNNVIGCVYTATDATGAPLGGPAQIGIEGQPLFNAPGNATSANLAPIVAMTFNVGGDYGGNAAIVTSGAGTITYSASEVLTVSRFEPSFPPFQGRTQESANVTFGALPQAGLTSITQNFDTAGRAPRHDHALVQSWGTTSDVAGKEHRLPSRPGLDVPAADASPMPYSRSLTDVGFDDRIALGRHGDDELRTDHAQPFNIWIKHIRKSIGLINGWCGIVTLTDRTIPRTKRERNHHDHRHQQLGQGDAARRSVHHRPRRFRSGLGQDR